MADQILGVELSAAEVAFYTGWPDAMVNDYISRTVDYMQVGEGSPEGAIASNRTRLYFDSLGGDLYANPLIGARTGWVIV